MDATERQRKLRLAGSAAASVVLNGCDPDEVRRAVEDGIAEALWLNNRQPGERRPGKEEGRDTTPADGTPALAQWARSVG